MSHTHTHMNTKVIKTDSTFGTLAHTYTSRGNCLRMVEDESRAKKKRINKTNDESVKQSFNAIRRKEIAHTQRMKSLTQR